MEFVYLYKLENLYSMGTIEKDLLEVVAKESEKFINNPILKKFDIANNNFKALVEKGIAKKRGNNLMSIEESQLNRFLINSK